MAAITDEAPVLLPPRICDEGTHIIQRLPSGVYVCVQCALMFHEHHELHIQVGVGAQAH